MEADQSLFPQTLPSRRPRKHDRREVVDAVLYVLRTGCQWRMLPHAPVSTNPPPWKSVYNLFDRWHASGLWERIHDALRTTVRRSVGKRPQPSAAVIDSQSVKTTHVAGPARGDDAGKKVKGRKRHIVVDTLGLLLAVVVHAADEQDWNGAPLVLFRLWEKMKRIRVIFADTVYGYRDLPAFTKATLGFRIEIVKRAADQPKRGFAVQPKRWIVERTFAWLSVCRRHSKDYERNPEVSETMLRLMLNRVDSPSS
jgi:putative transposase